MGRRSDARERLIDTARELIHARGYTAVGVAELCEKAGVNKGSFYYLYPSKQELALEVIDSFRADGEALLDEMLAGDGPPLQRLKRFFDETYRQHRGQRQQSGCVVGCPLGNLALELSTQDEVVRDRLRRVFDHQIDRFEKLVAEAVERGDVPPINARRAAWTVISLLEGAVMMAKTHDDPEPLAGLGEDVVRLLGAREAV